MTFNDFVGLAIMIVVGGSFSVIAVCLAIRMVRQVWRGE